MNYDIETLWEGDYVSVISPKDNPYEALHEKDGVHVLPLNIDTLEVYIRSEVCPPYSVKESDSSIEEYFTVISGGIEEGEQPIDAALREVEEEAGLVMLKDPLMIPLTPQGIPFMKGTTQRVSTYLMLFDAENVKEIEPEGDGTEYEARSLTFPVGFENGDIEEILKEPNCDYLLHALISKAKSVLSGERDLGIMSDPKED